MTITLNLRFQKFDQYGNYRFVCNAEKELDQYKALKCIEHKLKSLGVSFNPVYSTHEYSTITFKKYGLCAWTTGMRDNGIYQVEFVVNRSTCEKKYVSCFVKKMKLVASPDLGETIEIDI